MRVQIKFTSPSSFSRSRESQTSPSISSPSLTKSGLNSNISRPEICKLKKQSAKSPPTRSGERIRPWKTHTEQTTLSKVGLFLLLLAFTGGDFSSSLIKPQKEQLKSTDWKGLEKWFRSAKATFRFFHARKVWRVTLVWFIPRARR